MARGPTRRAVACLFAAAGVLAHAHAARAVEMLDGRIQVHGFVEEQLRVLDRGMSEEADLAQWYNVLNLELETDIAPNGWGPFDLISTYTRVEARYDCVYSRGCGTMRSVNTYGDRAKRLPGRLSDAKDQDYAGAIKTDSEVPRIADKRPAPFAVLQVIPNVRTGDPEFDATWIKQNNFTGYDPNLAESPANRPFITIVRKREGFPGFDTLFQTRGADAELGVNPDTGVNDDPANYTFEPVVDYLWALRSKKGPDGGTGQTMIMGPWLPKQTIQTLGTLQDRANPFRGILPPTRNGLATVGAQVPRSPVRRAVNIGPSLNNPLVPYPNDSPTGDAVDPRILEFFNNTTYGFNGTQARFPNFIGGLDGQGGEASDSAGTSTASSRASRPRSRPTARRSYRSRA